ncbi:MULTISPECIES: glycoside hydrolase family 26 protein [Brucella]|uniref:Beta-mannosidase n=2 Tax=Brucella suis TaxID=29461 RepID=A0AAI8EBE6_BRUSS|nr:MULTISPECIES: glycoside hydrolase family 26 protein [Brucella]AAN33739.1 endoglucanase family protein [Brucella suis 1330]AEM20016.1 endoglucanase family protein [Brucella suis 1330]AEU07686.1 endoglucanase family protein [Brucella suis VBI22]AHN48285.1 endoglucanase [Brucella suis bv. 1 str. S2]AIN85835.1 beta-mannosidase [Brucella suis]
MKRLLKVSAALLCGTMVCGAVYAASGVSGANVDTRNIFQDKRPVITANSVTPGAYDPHGDYTNDPNSKIEHLFLLWEDVDLTSLHAADAYVRERGRSLLITIEPWSWARDWRVGPEDLLSGILNGRYDSNMAAVCSEAAKLKSPVTIRWAQEMEDDAGQFTWAFWKPEGYVKAYRHVIDVCRKSLPSARYMWSPKGEEGLEAYYPGDNYVDIIGLSVFGYQPFDQLEVGRDTTFVERTKPGYDRVARFNKPIAIAELGYEGDDDYVRAWAAEANKPHAEFPAMTAVVYFNDREVYPWPRDVGRPDWRVANHPLD